jgi:hypothetical protein
MIATFFSNLSERKIFAILFIVSVLAGGSSIAYLTHVAHTSDTKMARGFPTASDTMPGEFATLTINMVDHGVFSMATTSPYTPNMWRTPGYSVFLTPFYALTGSFFPALFAQILLVFLTTILVFKMARRFMSDRWSLGLALLYIILPTTLLSVATIMNETLYTLVLMGAIYVFFFLEMKHMYAKWALTGFLLALAAYIKPGSLYILFFFFPGRKFLEST